MYITKKSLPRRTFLRGAGCALALPLLDAMIPAGTALADVPAAQRVRRLNILFFAHGMVMPQYTPPIDRQPAPTWAAAPAGTHALRLSPILSPLAPVQNEVVVLGGLCQKNADCDGAGHAGASAAWLTGCHPKRTEGFDVRDGVSIDQIAARQIGQSNVVPSLQLATEDFTGLVGACDVGYSCSYINTLSWADATTPLPNEINPRVVFEQLVGVGGTAAERSARYSEDRSMLDGMLPDMRRLRSQLDGADRGTVDDYIENVREIERRIQLARHRNQALKVGFAEPEGIPDSYEKHVKLMLDLQAFAFQADLTRVSTFVLSRELNNRTYPELGVPDANHMLSHHDFDPEKLVKLQKVQTWTVGLLTYYLDKLQSIPDGHGGRLLDSTVVLYGSSMSNSSEHSHYNLPLILAGDGIRGNRHIVYPDRTPMTNLLVTLLHRVGGRAERLGDSTGELTEI